jgi:hypothetical protein
LSPAWAAINDSSSTTYGAVDTVRFVHTTAGSDRYLLVGLSINNDNLEYATGVTFGGQPLTLVDSIRTVDDARVEIWELPDPPIGTDTVEIIFSAVLLRGGVAGALSFVGADTVGAVRSFASQAGGANPMELYVPSAADELIFTVAAGTTTTPAATTAPAAPATRWPTPPAWRGPWAPSTTAP